MRRALVLVVMLGCHDQTNVISDAQPQPVAIDAATEFDVACDASKFFCAGFDGACIAGLCREFCSLVDFPRCPMGHAESHSVVNLADLCVCVPQ